VLILAIDTSTRAGGVAALQDDRLLEHFFERSERPFSSRLFQTLDLLLERVGRSISDFDLFAVGAGPGSFTGLRVGLTAVKAWAELYHKPVTPVSGLEAIAAQALSETTLLAAVMDARRGQVFGGIYARDRDGLKLASEEMVASPEEFVAAAQSFTGAQSLSFVSPTPQVLAAALGKGPRSAPRVEQVSDDLAPWIGRIGHTLARRGDTVNALMLDANYVRRSDAELYWKP
jgi:tRNA threonylcarbamoyladenosine biosynthesis protein TsaB